MTNYLRLLVKMGLKRMVCEKFRKVEKKTNWRKEKKLRRELGK